MRIAVSKGHNVYNSNIFDNGASGNGKKEAYEVDKTVDILIPMLRTQGHYVVDVTPKNERFKNSKAAHQERADRVNKGNFDIYIDVHLNAGGGTGSEMWVYAPKGLSYDYARDILNNIVADTGLRNRGVKVKPTMWSLAMTNCPSIIIEGGFIDSKQDMDIITPELYAKSIARAFGEVEVISHSKSPNKLYRVQVGAYSVRDNAERLLKDLQSKGFNGFIGEDIVEVKNTTEVDSLPNKQPKKLVSYNSYGGSKVIEIDPLDLYIDVVKSAGSSIKGDFVNGGFYSTKTMQSISTLVSNGRVLAEHLPHDNVKRGTFVVRKDGTTSIEMVDFISKNPGINTVKFAIGGFNILPSHGDMRKQLKSEWFDYNTVGYKTWRTMIGYSAKVNKVMLVMVPNMTAQEGYELMKKIGCDFAVGLDSGLSTNGRFNGEEIRLTSRALHNIIRWN